MAVKIRLQRHGRKRKPFYHIVIADSRSPRDGKFIERIGSYNPNTNPATVDIDTDKAIDWLKKGAQPTDTANAILSYKGVLYKKHLLRGLAKGALTIEQVEAKYQEFVNNRDSQINAKKNSLLSASELKEKLRLDQEVAVARKKADAILAKKSALAGEVSDEAATEGEESTSSEEEATTEGTDSQE